MIEPHLGRIGAAVVGVLGHVTPSGRPNAVAVTPYVVDGELIVTSTLALVDKAAAMRLDPRVTLTAGGVTVSGTATIAVDPTPAWFDRHLRSQELAKYPPSRSLLAIPYHRHLLGWYVGRVVIRIDPASVTEQTAADRATVTVVDGDDRLRTWSVPPPPGAADAEVGDRLELAADVDDGPALLLVHEESADQRDLRQLGLRGTVQGGVLHVASRRGTLVPTRSGTLQQLAQLRTLGRRARANRELLASWPQLGGS
jgi:hypothetical protein